MSPQITPGQFYGTLLRRFARTGAQFSVAVGVAVVIGWFIDSVTLKSLLPGLTAMKMNTACGLIAAGASLWMLHSCEPGSWLYRVGGVLAVFVTALGGMTLAEELFGLDLGIDQLIVYDDLLDIPNPGRMALASQFSFLLTGAALISLKARSSLLAAWAHWLVVPPLLISTLVIVGYAYGVQTLYQASVFNSMALHAAVGFFILALSISAADFNHGFALIAVTDTAGGVVSRWLLPAIPVTLFLLGWIGLKGALVGLYGFQFGMALVVLMSITIFVIAMGWTATILHSTDVIRKVAETEIISLNAALELRRSEERFRILVRGVKDYAILMLDPQGFVESWNEGAERINGYKADEIVGQHFSRFYAAEDRASGKPQAALLQAVSRGEFEEEGWRLRKDSSGFWASVSITPLHNENGELRGFSKVTRDITERKKAEALTIQQVKELNRSNEDLSQFASVASHDLQEPLRMVITYTQLLSRRYKGKLDTEADELIAFAVDGANRMHELIRDLLAYSRVGTKADALLEIDSDDAFQQATNNLRGAVVDSGAQVTHDQLPRVFADRSQLVQVFQNLVGNAIKYQKAGTPRVHVSAAMNGSKRWSFSVKDNGLGIDPQNFERIFGMFQRLHTREQFAGTGIGLALCKKIVERHGGDISVESEPGQGSTFHFALAGSESGL
jgi:PAS domain S-box-containing protein